MTFAMLGDSLQNYQTSPLEVRVEETLDLRYLSALDRPYWEEAKFTLLRVSVTGGGRPPRDYGPDDPWDEPVSDPRADYLRVGSDLVRAAVPGRDYDPDRHLVSDRGSDGRD